MVSDKIKSTKSNESKKKSRFFGSVRLKRIKYDVELTPEERSQLLKDSNFQKIYADSLASKEYSKNDRKSSYFESRLENGLISKTKASLFDKMNIVVAILGVGFAAIFYIFDAKTSEFTAKLETSQTQILSEIKGLKVQVESSEKNTDYKLQIQKLEIEKEMLRK